MRKDATIELLEDIVKELEAESSIPQAARELAKKLIMPSMPYGISRIDYDKANATLLTAALKRCRNEALEEAAIVAENTSETSIPDENDPQMIWDVTADNSADAIRNLKEAE